MLHQSLFLSLCVWLAPRRVKGKPASGRPPLATLSLTRATRSCSAHDHTCDGMNVWGKHLWLLRSVLCFWTGTARNHRIKALSETPERSHSLIRLFLLLSRESEMAYTPCLKPVCTQNRVLRTKVPIGSHASRDIGLFRRPWCAAAKRRFAKSQLRIMLLRG